MHGRETRKKGRLADIIPGVIVGIVALAPAMTFVIASGVDPEKGLYTAIVAGFFVSVSAVRACRSPVRQARL